MLTHNDILGALQEEFSGGQMAGEPDGVFLVARLHDPDLAMADSTPYVFIPDTHLVPLADADRFRWVTARASQIDHLTRLAGILGRLRRTDASLRVWQLGDCFDLWRTATMGGNPEEDVSATQSAHPALFAALYRDAGLQVLAGNHDQELLKFRLPGGPQPLNTVILDRGNSTGDIVLAHGHQFDPVETLPRDIKEPFARGFTDLVPPTPRSMLEAANPHWRPEPINIGPPRRPGDANHFLHFGLKENEPVPLRSDFLNVVPYAPVHDPARALIDSFGAGGRKPTVDGPRQTFFTDIAWWAQRVSQNNSKDVRVIVIGHTHRARIVRGKRADGTPFVLMDCGAFVGTSFLSDEMDAPIASGQIGVRVGNDLRIYQLGYTIRTAEAVIP